MWQWILLILLPFIILAFIEETAQSSVHRYINGPSKLEVKMRLLGKKSIIRTKEIFKRIKLKLRKANDTSK